MVRPARTTSTDDVNNVNGISEAPQPGRKALATNAILQEKLSWYMDTVEVHLISAISTASTSFFAALGSLRELQTEAAESVAKIRELREDLKRLDEQMAIGGLEVVKILRCMHEWTRGRQGAGSMTGRGDSGSGSGSGQE